MVKLTGLPEEHFPAYRARLAKDYARDKVAAGVWSPEEAPRRAEADLDGTLPEGVNTRDHFLYEVRDASTSEEVGVLWLGIRKEESGPLVWIYDLEIFEGFRRKGYATRTLEAAEKEAMELGIDRVELHVFGHNAPARALYEKAGYTPASIVMVKQLGGEEA
jgi:RimJ/RimL family protein N-acetyltransferase